MTATRSSSWIPWPRAATPRSSCARGNSCSSTRAATAPSSSSVPMPRCISGARKSSSTATAGLPSATAWPTAGWRWSSSTADSAVMSTRAFTLEGALVVGLLMAFTLSCAQEGPGRSAMAAPTASYTVVAEGLAGPRGLVFAPSGDLYIAEQSGGSVARLGRDGRIVRIAKGFSHPHDLAIDAQGNLYLADSVANRIARISPSGEITTYLDSVQFPVDLDFNPQGELLICELYRGRVVAYKGRQMVRVVASGLSWPHGLAFGKHGEIFINENTGNRINKLVPGSPMSRFAEVERPVGLAFGPS